MFEVSRSGYYAWRRRQGGEAKDQWLVDLITDCQQRCKQTYGCRRVRRWIQRQTGKKVNLKAILRIMRKFDLLAQIRRRRPYSHYKQAVRNTLQAYFDLSQEYHFQPSMSSPGCPYDNAAMENFFGTLKTECLYRMKFSCRSQLEQAVAEYVQFYNFERIHLKNGLTPFEIRSKAA